MSGSLPDNLGRLHAHEEELRRKALSLIESDQRLTLHVEVVEKAMDVADLLRQVPTADEDLKVVQMLAMRIVNAFAASSRLALSGYAQSSARILRDVLETAFLLDLFDTDRAAITRWRSADEKQHRAGFAPVKVRAALDKRDGFTGKKRDQRYRLLSQLAAHPTMRSVLMMRPRQDGDAVSGSFVEQGPLRAVLEEMGRLAVEAGGHLCAFFPDRWTEANLARLALVAAAERWMTTFYGDVPSAESREGSA